MRWWASNNKPSVRRLPIGEIAVSSGCLLLADPQYIESPLVVELVPIGMYQVAADVIYYPEGSSRIARVFFRFGASDTSPLQEIGQVPIDSAKMVAIDRRDYETYWTEFGPDRIGVVPTPQDRRVVELLKKHFNLDCAQINAVRAEVIQPISHEMEEEIDRLLQAIPEYAQFPFMHFYVQTNNTFEKANFASAPWATIELDKQSGRSLLTFDTGYGDGTYPVFGRFYNGNVTSLEIPFIEEIK